MKDKITIPVKELSQIRKSIINKLIDHEPPSFEDIKGLRFAKTDDEKKGWIIING